MIRMSVLIGVLTVSLALALPLAAFGETTTRIFDGRKLVVKKTGEVSTEGKVRFTKAEVSVSDDQTAILVDQSNDPNIFIPLHSDGDEAGPIIVSGWSGPSLIPHSARVVTKTSGYVMVNAPGKGAVNQLAAFPHRMQEGDRIDPAVSPRGDIIATRPSISEVQFWDLKTLKPLTDPIEQPSRVSRISFSSDGKYFRVYAGDYLTMLNPRTGEVVAEPRLSGPFRYYPSTKGTYFYARPRAAYEPTTERVVYFHNMGKDTSLECEAFIRSVSGKSRALFVRLDVHAYQASWIDADHLLIQGGRKLETNWYDTYPLLVISLTGKRPKVTELHPDINHYGISPNGKHIVGTTRVRAERRSVCWRVDEPEPLWTGAGSFAGFGKDGWVLTHNQGQTATIRSIETGDSLWEQPKVLIAKPKGQHVWLFFEHSFQSWKADWRSVSGRPDEEPAGTAEDEPDR